MTHTRKILRVFLCIQIILLTLTLAAFGAVLAAERTRYVAQGAPAASQREAPLPIPEKWTRAAVLPDKQTVRRMLSYAAALPAPFGCAAALVCAAWDVIEKTDFSALDILNKTNSIKPAL